MKSVILIIVMFAIGGCGSSKQYMLTVDNSVLSKTGKKSMQIGVDKVSVPGYMEESQIAIEESSGEISYRSDIWAVPTAKALTQTMISSLQKKFSNPNVYLYPWDTEQEKGLRIKVTINRFIYTNGSVRLDGTYFIKPIGRKAKPSYMFSTKIESSSDTASIVHGMNRAFAMLINDVSRHMH